MADGSAVWELKSESGTQRPSELAILPNNCKTVAHKSKKQMSTLVNTSVHYGKALSYCSH